MSRERKNILKASEWIALLVVMHYCVYCFMRPTSFVFEYSPIHRKLTFLSLALVGSFRLLAGLWREFRESGITRGLIGKILLIGVSGICCLILEIRFEYTFFLFMLFAAFCLYGIDADKILKAFTICIGAMLASVVLCCLTGVIPNYVYMGTEETQERLIRASYGISYTTNFASYLFFLILLFWCGGKRKPVLPMLGLVALAFWFIYNQANSNSTELCLLLTAAAIFWETMERRVFRNRKTLLNITGWIAVGIFPVLGIFFYGLTWLYGQGNAFAVRTDTFLHSRLSLTWDGIQAFGINAFGSAASQNGAGGGDIPKWTDGYNFLDSSYGMMLVRYGWVLTLIVTALWVWMTRKAVKNGYRSLAYAMAIIAVHSFSEHHFTDIQYNILLALPLCCLIRRSETKQQNEKALGRKRISGWIPWLAAGGTAAGCFLLLPTGLAYLRTAFELKGWENSFRALLCCLLCVVLAGLLVFFLSKLIGSLIEKKKACWIGLACTVCTMCAVFLWTGMTVNSGKTAIRLSADAEPLQVVLASTKEPVYADSLEALYRQEYPGIFGRIWTAEEMAGIREGTILTDREPELNKLISTGAIYAEISDYSSIYTYDWDVAEALKSAGYLCHGFYFTERALDNEKLAALNDLERAEDGALFLTEDKNSIVEEPELSLYQGDYKTTFNLSLDSQTDKGTVCTVAVTTYEGENQILEQEISAEEFDENGHAAFVCDYGIASSRDVRFEVQSLTPLKVDKISWRRDMPYDTWVKYDPDGKALREVYYALDGQPYIKAGGYSAIEQEYDTNGCLLHRRYYDADGQWITRTDGVREIRWIHNDDTGAYDVSFIAESGETIDSIGINLARDIPGDAEGWSAWMIPGYNAENSCMNIGYLNLGNKKAGDLYTCQIEIEFKGVTGTDGEAFKFWTQGAADGKWDTGNVWNGNLVYLDAPPQDGIYTYTVTNTVNEKMLPVTDFDLGFRCDNWKSGMFRVRKVMVVSGDTIGEWSPGI